MHFLHCECHWTERVVISSVTANILCCALDGMSRKWGGRGRTASKTKGKFFHGGRQVLQIGVSIRKLLQAQKPAKGENRDTSRQQNEEEWSTLGAKKQND